MPINFTTKTDDQLRWPEFVNDTEAKYVLAKAGRGITDYASDMQYLKLHLSKEEYRKFFARYRQFKHRRMHTLVTVKVPRATLDRLSRYAESLGYPEVERSSFVDILHFLTDPQEMFECRQKIEKLASTTLEANNNQPIEI